MKNIIICCDGTWNNPEQEDNGIAAPTNVVKLRHALTNKNSQGISQIVYYHPGVGGEDKGPIKAVLGGAVGAGISRHIRNAYHWLAQNYEEGDRIFLFGFSRGGFTVRSLAGMIELGLLDLRDFANTERSEESRKLVRIAYSEGYRSPHKTKKLIEVFTDEVNLFHQGDAPKIHFLGVWDTVGALGVPDDLELFNIFDNPSKWQFHNTTLGKHVQHARHAVALDEIRTSFSATSMKKANSDQDLVELWFPGVHSDVGGGYAETDLSDGALSWMIHEARNQGLGFRSNIDQIVVGKPTGVIHNSYRGVFAKLRSRPRSTPALTEKNKQHFHESVWIRRENSPIEHPPYHPTITLEPGQSVTVTVFAKERWNPTYVFLEKGVSYRFSSVGKWVDKDDPCDWKGTKDGKFTTGDIARAGSSFLGAFEGILKKRNPSTDFLFTRRDDDRDWFALIGAIANGAGVSGEKACSGKIGNDGSAPLHQYVQLSEHKTKSLEVKCPGYLYCFANDVWTFYGNNKGSIQLTIHREEGSE